jgi:hypothetical protein
MADEGRVPFEYRFTTFLPPKQAPKIPFAVGGGTQSNPEHRSDNINNQDASRLILSENWIIGVVCDGCAGTHRSIEEFTSSSNEVGAKLLSHLVCEKAQWLLRTSSLKDQAVFLHRLSGELTRALEALTIAFCGDDEFARECFAFDFLSATILGFVVTAEEYLIFYAGDGIIGVNDEVQFLKDQEGTYFAGNLAWRLCPSLYSGPIGHATLNMFRSGPTQELRNIFLGTDGLYGCIDANRPAWLTFLASRPPDPENGLDFLLPEFRTKIAWTDSCIDTFRDDATFVLLRRVDEIDQRPDIGVATDVTDNVDGDKDGGGLAGSADGEVG